MTGSPYLQENRLSEVIAAVTAMGLYRYYKLPYQDWAERIANAANKGEHWDQLFAEHPEFSGSTKNARRLLSSGADSTPNALTRNNLFL